MSVLLETGAGRDGRARSQALKRNPIEYHACGMASMSKIWEHEYYGVGKQVQHVVGDDKHRPAFTNPVRYLYLSITLMVGEG